MYNNMHPVSRHSLVIDPSLGMYQEIPPSLLYDEYKQKNPNPNTKHCLQQVLCAGSQCARSQMSDWDEKRAEVGPGCYEGGQQSHKIQIAITKIMKIDFPIKGKELRQSKFFKNHEIERLFTIWYLNGEYVGYDKYNQNNNQRRMIMMMRKVKQVCRTDDRAGYGVSIR